jgi:hypothetical protein
MYSQKVPISFTMSVRLSVCLSACISALPTAKIPIKFDIGDLYEISWETANLVKIGQKYEALYMKTYKI